jgi:hypothetical protein
MFGSFTVGTLSEGSRSALNQRIAARKVLRS